IVYSDMPTSHGDQAKYARFRFPDPASLRRVHDRRIRRATDGAVLPHQHHLRTAEQGHLLTGRLVYDDCVPHLRLAAQVRRRATTDDAFTGSGGRQEVRLQLDGRERRTLWNLGATPDGCAGISKGYDRGCEQESRPRDQVLGYVDVADHEVARRMIEHA